MDTSPGCGIDFYFSSPLEQCDCNKIIFTIANKPVTRVAKRHPKDERGDFLRDAGSIAFTILMVRFKLENKPGTGTYGFPLAVRGTIEASAYDVIEKAGWLPAGFSNQTSASNEHQILRLRQSTKSHRKMVSIQIDTSHLPARNVHFYQVDRARELRRPQLKTLHDLLTRRWQIDRRPSRNKWLEQAREVVAQRVSKMEKRKTGVTKHGIQFVPPPLGWPTVAKAFPAASMQEKMAMIKEEQIPLLEECAKLTEKENPDAHLRLLTMITVLNYQEGHLNEALLYAKRAASLGHELGDPYAAQLGQVLIEDLHKRLAPKESNL